MKNQIRDEDWLIPEKIIDNGYHEYQDEETGLIFTQADLAAFAIKADELLDEELPSSMFRSHPIKYTSSEQKEKAWELIIQPWMSSPDRLTIQDMQDRADEISKQRYMEAISYIPEANRVKE